MTRGLDTNVLVRYLTDDDAVQSRKATALIETAVARGDRLFIGPVVLCELAWVLRWAYDVSKDDLVETLERILATSQFVIGDKDVVRRALEAYRTGKGDFADYVIGEGHRAGGAPATVTFDRRLRGSSAFTVV
jgi:predicted nucleic-acid-binding protein